jgi:hypothetical protein
MAADGYPNTMPTGATWVSMALASAPAAGNYDLRWTGTGMSNLSIVNGTLVSGPTYVGSQGSAVITFPSDRILGTHNGTVGLHYAISSSANYPHNFSVRPVGAAATDMLNTTWLTRMTEVTRAGGYIRPMDATWVNRNSGVNTSLIGSTRPLNPTNRQKIGTGAWTQDDGDFSAYKTDGLPVEIGVAMANALNRNLKWPLPWNGTQAYYEDIVDAVLRDVTADPFTSGLNAGLTIAFSLSNEVWNFGFTVAGQARDEANDLQLDVIFDNSAWTAPTGGSSEGYCYRFVQVMQWIIARWNAHARSNKPTMKRVFEWQNAAGGGWAQTLLNYIPKGAAAPSLGNVAVKTVATDYWTAPYAACNATAMTTVAQVIAALRADIPAVMANARDCSIVAATMGLGYGCYEGGPYPNGLSSGLLASLQVASEMNTFITDYLQAFQTTVGNYPFCYYSNHGRGQWGALEYTTLSPTLANAPKHIALRDFAGTVTPTASSAWNPLTTGTAPSSSGYSYSGSNRYTSRTSGSGDALVRGTTPKTSGYFEVTLPASGVNTVVGVANAALATNAFVGSSASSYGYYKSGQFLNNGGSTGASPASFDTNTISVCIKANKLYFAKDGVWQAGGDPSAGTGGIDISAIIGSGLYPAASTAGAAIFAINTGGSAFAYTLPTGVSAWG